jgi:soluble lytic murein transglycosylase-like protein
MLLKHTRPIKPKAGGLRQAVQVVLLIIVLMLPGIVLAGKAGWQCWADAAIRYNVPIDLLYAIARVESGNKYNVVSGKNRNGSYDIGLMQINSSHLPRLRRYGITEKDLLQDPCLNLHVGAWILADAIERHGYNWVAIGAYNAASPDKRKTYAHKVMSMHQRILKERRTQ